MNNYDWLECVPCRLEGTIEHARYIVNGFSLCVKHEEMWGDGYMTFKDGEPVNYNKEGYEKS